MTLFEIASNIKDLPGETYICARRPWSSTSECLLVPYPDDLGIPKEVKDQGFEYFLEVDTAIEILDGFLETKPSNMEITNFLIYYAENDAFPDC